MFFPDLIFNLLMAGIDVAAVAFCLTQRRELRPLTLLFLLLCIFIPAAFLLILAVGSGFGLRHFGLIRMAGFALSVHLPLLIAAYGALVWNQQRWRWTAMGFTLVLVAGATFAYQIEPYRLEITEFAVTSPRLKGLTRPIRIAQVADFQTDAIGPYEQRVFDELKRLEPDLVLFLGDYLQIPDPEERGRQAEAFRDLLSSSGLNPAFGAYAVQGDCERWPDWATLFADTPVLPLNNEVRVLELPGVSVNLIALDNHTSRTRSLEELMSIAQLGTAERLNLFMGHSPDYSDQLAGGDQPFLAFAGHTHGGQVRIPFWGPLITFSRLPRKFADAFVRFGPGVLSVSRGIGMERSQAPRVRLFCRPELRSVILMPPDADEIESLKEIEILKIPESPDPEPIISAGPAPSISEPFLSSGEAAS